MKKIIAFFLAYALLVISSPLSSGVEDDYAPQLFMDIHSDNDPQAKLGQLVRLFIEQAEATFGKGGEIFDIIRYPSSLAGIQPEKGEKIDIGPGYATDTSRNDRFDKSAAGYDVIIKPRAVDASGLIRIGLAGGLAEQGQVFAFAVWEKEPNGTYRLVATTALNLNRSMSETAISHKLSEVGDFIQEEFMERYSVAAPELASRNIFQTMAEQRRQQRFAAGSRYYNNPSDASAIYLVLAAIACFLLAVASPHIGDLIYRGQVNRNVTFVRVLAAVGGVGTVICLAILFVLLAGREV